jgi:hypothetical protein
MYILIGKESAVDNEMTSKTALKMPLLDKDQA